MLEDPNKSEIFSKKIVIYVSDLFFSAFRYQLFFINLFSAGQLLVI